MCIGKVVNSQWSSSFSSDDLLLPPIYSNDSVQCIAEVSIRFIEYYASIDGFLSEFSLAWLMPNHTK